MVVQQSLPAPGQTTTINTVPEMHLQSPSSYGSEENLDGSQVSGDQSSVYQVPAADKNAHNTDELTDTKLVIKEKRDQKSQSKSQPSAVKKGKPKKTKRQQ